MTNYLEPFKMRLIMAGSSDQQKKIYQALIPTDIARLIKAMIKKEEMRMQPSYFNRGVCTKPQKEVQEAFAKDQ